MHSIVSNTELTEANLEELRDFLEKNDLPGLVEFHGFLTAIISGPNLIMPSEWIDFLGINNQAFDSMEYAQKIMGTLMAIYNDISTQLQNNSFRVIKSRKNQNKGETAATNRVWAKGYMLGMSIDKSDWLGEEDLTPLLLPILFVNISDELLQELIDENGIEHLPEQIENYDSQELSQAANEVYQYWLMKSGLMEGSTEVSAQKTKTERNKPCPCGSGQKYKKCCLRLH